jgi:curved DNA-binding protein CbpA
MILLILGKIMEDLYRILGVNQSATADEIKKAYHDLAMRYHPDFNPGDSEAEYIFKKINNAYSILSNAALRSEYDEQITQCNEEEHDGKGHKETASQTTAQQQTQDEERVNLSIYTLFSKVFKDDFINCYNKDYNFENAFRDFEKAIEYLNMMPEYIKQKKNEAPEQRRPQFDKVMKKVEPARKKIISYYEEAKKQYKKTHQYGFITDTARHKLARKISNCLSKSDDTLITLGMEIDSANHLTPKEQREANKKYFEKREEEFIRKEYGPAAVEKYRNRNKSLPYIYITLLFGCIAIYMFILRKYAGQNMAMTCISSAIAGFVICISLAGLLDGFEEAYRVIVSLIACIIISVLFVGAGWILYFIAPLTKLLSLLILIACPIVYIIILFFLY